MTHANLQTPQNAAVEIADAKPATCISTKVFDGHYLVYRKQGAKLSMERRKTSGPPRFRHPSFEAASIETTRLIGLFPESTFVILHEVARTKLKPVASYAAPEPKRPTDGDEASVFEAHAAWVRRTDPDALTGCADDQTFAAVPVAAVRDVLR